ncbi:MAG: aldolase/citrate lyase family protein [Novosphingobium sp.]|nr:aldolase/citrate lyase family protein [Novosphingobium sp.]
MRRADRHGRRALDQSGWRQEHGGDRPDERRTADGLILDLEDAVAHADKATARGHVVDFLASRPKVAQALVVRINPLDQVHGLDDLAVLARLEHGPDFILVPKVEEAGQIAAVGRLLRNSGSKARTGALIESARGVGEAMAIARSDDSLAFLMFGAADYASDLGQQVGSFRPDHARATLVNAAAAGGVVAIDSPFFAIDRPDDLQADCTVGRAMGFHGKAAIHPSQVDAIRETYEPSDAERDQARRILDAAPNGVGVLDGKMIDIAMVRWARRLA